MSTQCDVLQDREGGQGVLRAVNLNRVFIHRLPKLGNTREGRGGSYTKHRIIRSLIPWLGVGTSVTHRVVRNILHVVCLSGYHRRLDGYRSI